MAVYNKKHFICSVDNCLNKHYALGLCDRHWDRLQVKKKQDNSLWEGISKFSINDELMRSLNKLAVREKEIILLRFRGKKSLREVSVKLGTSPERIRQIEAKALKKMRGFILDERKEEL